LKYYYLLNLLKDNKNKIIFEDKIYYFELNSPNEIGINKDNNLIIEATIINMEMINKIKIAKSDKDIINSSKNIIINYDLSTNSAFISLNKTYCEKIWNSLDNNNGNAYLYISIRQNKSKEIDKDISGQMIVSFRNNKNYVIPSNQIINTKIDVSENNISYSLYNLQLDGSFDKNKIVLDISPNIAINENNLLYSLIDYKAIEKLNDSIIKKNSSNIEIDEKNSKYIGGKYHIEFILKEKEEKGIYLCLFSDKKDLKDNELKIINVLFKYLTLYPKDILPKYEIDDNIAIKQNKTHIILNIIKIKKNENSIITYPKCEFTIRKIKKEDKISNEELNSITLLESKFDILHIYKDDKNNNNIKIEIPYKKKENEKFYISIIANLYEDNEKFAYQIIEVEINEDKSKTSVIVLIVIMIIIILILVVLLYLYINRKKMNKNTEKLLQISFNDKNKDEFDNNILYQNQNENQLDNN
jgi:cbb3-type cytochrome oxidase subunit 3